MPVRNIGRSLLTATCMAALLLGGCVVAPVGPYGGHVPYGGVIGVAPPPDRYEVVGVAPVLGQVWLSGYWAWGGGHHHWVPGRWAAPRHGHDWVPHRWERSGGGWRLNQGHWRRR